MTSRIEALSSTRTLAAGILWNGLGRGLPIIVALCATPFLLHHLGIDRWALLTLALSIAGSFSLLDFGISAALTRALAERIGTPEERNAAPLIVAALSVLLLTGTAGAAIAYAVTPSIIDRLLNVPPDLHDEAIASFRVLTLAGPLIIINAAMWGVMSAYQHFRLATLVNIPVNVLYYVGPILVLLVWNSLVPVIATLVAARLLQAVVCTALTVRIVPDLARFPAFRPGLLRPLLRIGAWVTVSNTLWPVMLYFDRFIVGALLPLAAVSYYATSLDMVMRLLMVPMAVAATLFPAVATSHRTMPDRARALLRVGVLATIVCVFPMCLLLAGLARELLTAWLGASFAADSWIVLTILAAGMYLNCVVLLPGTLTDAIGRPDIGAKVMLVQALVFPPIVLLLTRNYGIEGAAVAWTFRALANALVRLLICRRLGPSVAPSVPALLCVSVVGVAAMAIGPLIDPLPARLIALAATAIAFPLFAGAVLLGPDEIADMRGVLRKIVPRLSIAPRFRRT